MERTCFIFLRDAIPSFYFEAEKVKKDKTKSALYGLDNINTLSAKSDISQFPELNKRRVWSLIVFGIMILVIVLGYIPWSSMPVGDHTMYDVVNAPASWLEYTFHLLDIYLVTAGFTLSWCTGILIRIFNCIFDWFCDCSSD